MRMYLAWELSGSGSSHQAIPPASSASTSSIAIRPPFDSCQVAQILEPGAHGRVQLELLVAGNGRAERCQPFLERLSEAGRHVRLSLDQVALLRGVGSNLVQLVVAVRGPDVLVAVGAHRPERAVVPGGVELRIALAKDADRWLRFEVFGDRRPLRLPAEIVGKQWRRLDLSPCLLLVD